MKKILKIFLLLSLLISLTCCANREKINETTSHQNFKTSLNSSSFFNEKTQKNNTITTKYSNISTQKNSEISTTIATLPTTKILTSDTLNENSAPQILYLTLEDIIAVETAYNNMKEEEFENFISNYPKHYNMNGIENRSDAKIILDELKETTIILLDGDKNNISEMYFYLGRNEIQQSIIVEGDRRIVCYYYTPQNINGSSSKYSNSNQANLVKEITVNGITAKVSKFPNSELFFADISLNNTVICYRVTEAQTIEEFEADFTRLKFVKIGDLL